MMADTPQIVIEHPAEKISVRDITIEQIARLLARADGVDPDSDMRCHADLGNMSGACTLQAGPLGSFAAWRLYRSKAEALLREAFKS